MTNHCPVCDKVGIPDFRTQHTVCPQCNADLKAYMLLGNISKGSGSNRLSKFLFFGISSLCLAFLFMISKNYKKNNQLATEINSIQDSLKYYKIKSNPIAAPKVPEKEISIQYIVKKGDYPSKIASFFYNDWRMYKKIKEDNNLKGNYILKVGQKLVININE